MNPTFTEQVYNRLKAGERLPWKAQTCRATEVEPRLSEREDPNCAKVSIKACTRDVYEHPELGRVVYDFSTMRMDQKCAIDWEHTTPIGICRPYLNDYGLVADGTITRNSHNPQFIGNDVLHMVQTKIPLQSSIDWRGSYDLDFIPSNRVAQVNNQDVEGPCFVVRNWALRAIAMCEVGKDPTTSAQLNSTLKEETAPQHLREVGQKNSAGTPAASKENPMPEPITPVTTAAPAAPVTQTNSASQTECMNCKNSFDFGAQQKNSEGEVTCPNCNSLVNEDGKTGKITRFNSAAPVPVTPVAPVAPVIPAAAAPAVPAPVTQTNSAPAAPVAPAPAATPATPAPAAVPTPAPVALKVTQTNSLAEAEAATNEAVKETLEGCITACEKVLAGCTYAQYCIDSCKTAIAAIGQTNGLDELCEAGYAAMGVARSCAEMETPEAKDCAFECLQVATMVNDIFGWQMCSAKDNSIYVPKAKRQAAPAAPAPVPVQTNSAAPIAPPTTPAPTGQATAPSQQNSAASPEAKPVVPAADEGKATTPATPQPTQKNALTVLKELVQQDGLDFSGLCKVLGIADPTIQLNAAKESETTLKAQLAEAQQRIDVMAGGAAPVPMVPKPGGSTGGFKNFTEALNSIKATQPDDTKAYLEAKRLYPALVQQLNSQPVARPGQ